ncbi:MAG: hypothetical protein HZA53_19540 [Planctomycetes bacterium]|nr:hypothetical protein [Planctomycetota bacterium]
MIQHVEDKAEFDEPVNPLDLMTEEELRSLSDEERERIDGEWFERFQAWSRRFRREALEEIRELERTRGFFGITTSV